jgi:hypothetical protein
LEVSKRCRLLFNFEIYSKNNFKDNVMKKKIVNYHLIMVAVLKNIANQEQMRREGLC